MRLTRLNAWSRCMARPLALLALGAVTTLPARAQMPFADRIPSNAMVAAGISNTGPVWQKLQQLPVTRGIQNFMASPTMMQNEGYQSFIKQRDAMSQKLGFPATLEHMMSEVFASGAFYMVPGPAQGEPGMVLLLGAKDKAKVAQMIQALDDKNRQMSGQDATTGTATAAQGYLFEKVQLGGVEASHLVSDTELGDSEHMFYGLAQDALVVSNDRDAFTAALAAAAQSIGANPDFQQLSGKLPWQQSDISFFMDADRLLQMAPQAAMLQNLPGMAKSNKIATTINVLPDGIVSRGVTTADPAAGVASVQGRTLEGLNTLPANPIIAFAYALFDAPTSLQSLDALSGMAAMMGAQSGMGTPMADFEAATSISLQNELAPALGHELIFAFNDLAADPNNLLIPNIDLVFGASVTDRAKMETILGKLEAVIARQLNAAMSEGMDTAGAAAAAPTYAWEAVQAGGATIRTIQSPLNVPFSHVLTDKYVFFSLAPQALQATLARTAAPQAGVTQSPIYQELAQMANGAKPYSYTTVDFRALTQKVLLTYVPFVANMTGLGVDPMQINQFLMEIVAPLGVAAEYETRQDGLTMMYSRIKMQ